MSAELLPLLEGGDGLFLNSFGTVDQFKIFGIEPQNGFSGGMKIIHEIQSSGKLVIDVPA